MSLPVVSKRVLARERQERIACLRASIHLLEQEIDRQFATRYMRLTFTRADLREMLEERQMRRAARTDNNQALIVTALRAAGCLVLDIHALGQGAPDLLVWSPVEGALHLLECKSPGGVLTDDEAEFGAVWPVAVVRSPADALRAVGLEVDDGKPE